jgi:hypothetical protein
MNQWPSGDWSMKITEDRKYCDTLPLTEHILNNVIIIANIRLIENRMENTENTV